MSIGSNLSFLRKQRKLTQEQLAEKMNVTRQTISRWEADEVTPELERLISISEFFTCSLDNLVREELNRHEKIYSEVTIRNVHPFEMAMYVVISRDPESDALGYMEKWATEHDVFPSATERKLIGWDFPFVTQEQQNRFGLRGYVAACVLPPSFVNDSNQVHFQTNEQADYAVITIREPFIQPFHRIPNAYKRIMEFLQEKKIKQVNQEGVVPCFEYEYSLEGTIFMDVFIHVESQPKRRTIPYSFTNEAGN